MRQPDRAKAAPEETSAAKPEISDRVEISLDARAKLAELADRELKDHGFRADESLSRADGSTDGERDRISEIREKIESGFYDRPEIRDRIATNLTDELDLG